MGKNFVSYEDSQELMGAIKKKLYLVTDTMPTASAALEGKQIQYIGSVSPYAQGAVYECREVTPATSPKTYQWVELYKAEFVLDNVPTKDSNNAVKSGGVYSSELSIYNVMSRNGAKNLVPYPYRAGTYSSNNVTFTNNGDGTITVETTNAGASAQTVFNLFLRTVDSNPKFYLANGDYIVSDGVEGTSATYEMQLGQTGADGNYLTLAYIREHEMPFTINGDNVNADKAKLQFAIVIRSGTVITTPITFKPMIRLASDPDDSWVPYAKTNSELTEDKADIDTAFNIYGAKNIINNPYIRRSGYVTGGLTFTYDDDGIITVNGTYDNTTRQFALNASSLGSNGLNLVADRKYILSFEISGFSETTYGASIFLNINSSDVCALRDVKEDGYHEIAFIPTAAQASSNSIVLSTYFRSDSNASEVTNATIKPMLRLADTDNTWEPYAKTNRQITQDDELKDYVNILGAKNLIPYPYSAENGAVPVAMGTIDFGDVVMTEENGVLTFNGTVTSSRNPCALLGYPTGKFMPVENKKYIFTQGCESEFKGGCRVTTRWQKADGTTSVFTANAEKTLIDNTDGTYVGIVNFSVWFSNETVLDNYVLKPMLRLASIEDDTYEPYAPTNKDAMDYRSNRRLGAKNLLPYPYNETTKTINGITFTDNGDGTVTIKTDSGGATASTRFYFQNLADKFDLENGEYILSDNSLDSSKVYSEVALYNGSTYQYIAHRTYSNNEQAFALSDTPTRDRLTAYIQVIQGYTNTTGFTFKPMIRIVSDTDNIYAPYAMTNKQLTDKVKELEETLNKALLYQ